MNGMNINGFGACSFSEIMNSGCKRNGIPLVNQIVSFKNTEDNEIYRAYFTDDKVTCQNSIGQKSWEKTITNASQAQNIKESLSGITLYSQDSDTGKKALTSVGFPDGGSISVFKADNFSEENPIYTVKYWDENGVESEYTIDLRKVNPENASYLEMAAYTTYLDTTGQTKDAFGDFVGVANGINDESVADLMNINDKADFLGIIYEYMQMQYDANNLEGYLSLKSLYDCMTGGENYEPQGFIAEFVDYQEFHKAWMSQGANTPFSYTENKGFNEAENSISLVPGMSVRLNNGFMISITESMVQAVGDFMDNTAAKESTAVAGALNHLIKVANGQIPMNMFYSRNQDNSAYAKIGLQALGIDTSRPFTINEKTFHFDSDGQIRLRSGTDEKSFTEYL